MAKEYVDVYNYLLRYQEESWKEVDIEIIRDGEIIGRIHDDYCCKDDEEAKKILDNVAQKVYQHLAAKNGDSHVLKGGKSRW